MSKIIKLTQGYETTVDNEDHEWLSQWKWRTLGNVKRGRQPYACRSIKKVLVSMARLIMNAPEGYVVDHINGNTLDNQKENLRICTFAENIKNKRRGPANKYGYKGIFYDRRYKKFFAKICSNYTKYYGPACTTAAEAAKEYNKLALKHHGKFAALNNV